VAVGTALVTAGVVAAAPAFALADGVAATDGQFPFAVRLVMTGVPDGSGGTYDSACSGAVISPTRIITAGHCFHDAAKKRVSGPPRYQTTATVGTADVATDPGVSYGVTYVWQSSSADVAVAKLSAATDAAPLHLATSRPARGEIVTMAGWGATSDVDPTPSAQLYWGRMKVTGVTSSTVSVVGYYPAKDTSACLYDSGAPYFTTPAGSAPLLVSTESSGPDCPHTSAETTARIDDIVSWIRSVTPDLPQ
jgi:secreted trypsin-like serine protease